MLMAIICTQDDELFNSYKDKVALIKVIFHIKDIFKDHWNNFLNVNDTIRMYKKCNIKMQKIDYIMNITNNNIFISYQDSSIIVGKNLKKMRIEKLLKQKDIYSFLNISSSSYSSYETGNILIQTESIYKIAKKYNYSVDKLLKK